MNMIAQAAKRMSSCRMWKSKSDFLRKGLVARRKTSMKAWRVAMRAI